MACLCWSRQGAHGPQLCEEYVNFQLEWHFTDILQWQIIPNGKDLHLTYGMTIEHPSWKLVIGCSPQQDDPMTTQLLCHAFCHSFKEHLDHLDHFHCTWKAQVLIPFQNGLQGWDHIVETENDQDWYGFRRIETKCNAKNAKCVRKAT